MIVHVPMAVHPHVKNVLVLGGSGSGKTRYHIKPNLLQMNASYVCSDPKGTVVEEVGQVLIKKGHYKLKILNTIDFSASMHYNPFHYLHSETDILSLVTVIMRTPRARKRAAMISGNRQRHCCSKR